MGADHGCPDTTGATGRFVVTVTPDNAPFEELRLINFGANQSVPMMKGMRVTGINFPDNLLTLSVTEMS